MFPAAKGTKKIPKGQSVSILCHKKLSVGKNLGFPLQPLVPIFFRSKVHSIDDAKNRYGKESISGEWWLI